MNFLFFFLHKDASNTNGGHWSLFFVDVRKGLLYFIDPIGANTPFHPNIHQVFQKWNVFAHSQPFLRDKIWEKKVIEHSEQKDGYNCGILVCFFYESLLNGNSLTQDESDTIATIRKRIAEFILKK